MNVSLVSFGSLELTNDILPRVQPDVTDQSCQRCKGQTVRDDQSDWQILGGIVVVQILRESFSGFEKASKESALEKGGKRYFVISLTRSQDR